MAKGNTVTFERFCKGKQCKEIRVELEDLYNKGFITGDLASTIKCLQELKKKHTGYRDVCIEVDTVQDPWCDNSSYASIVLTGLRKETKEERLQRLRKEYDQTIAMQEREREQYERLRKKFG